MNSNNPDSRIVRIPYFHTFKRIKTSLQGCGESEKVMHYIITNLI